jgi:melanoma-associated antigen p97
MLFKLILTIFVTLCILNKKCNSLAPNLQMLGRWCCVNEKEYSKCEQWKLALLNLNQSSVLLDCVLAHDKFDCFKKIFEDQADLMTADAGDIYTAGKYYNLVPISSEVYSDAASNTAAHSGFYAVAVVKRGSDMTIEKLRGSNSCHGGVGTSSGWNIPISTLIEKKLLEIVDCNNHVKAATNFFNKMCAPDALNSQFNPTGDNPTSACELCTGKIGSTFCTNQDPYAGNIGALYCLNDGGGNVSFVKHTAVNEWAAINRSININDFELLCPNNPNSSYPYSTAPISQYATCNWGQVPGRAILTSSRKALQQKINYKQFLRLSASMFTGKPPLIPTTGGNNFITTTNSPNIFTPFTLFPPVSQQQMATFFPMFTLFPPSTNLPSTSNQTNTNNINFFLFDSTAYNGRDLLFIDQVTTFEDLENDITYTSFLNKKCKFLTSVYGIN